MIEKFFKYKKCAFQRVIRSYINYNEAEELNDIVKLFDKSFEKTDN